MRELLEGHATYRLQARSEREFLAHLASETQSPGALFVGCSDSRVIPELLTSSAPGELFVVRNVANVVPRFEHADASVGAALEYAVGVLGVQHVVVCGHTRCGGVHAMLHPHEGHEVLPSLSEWLEEPGQALRDAVPPDGEDRWRRGVERNAVLQLRNLASYPVLARALAEDRLELHAWVYDLDSGHVSVFDADHGGFVDAHDALLADR